MSLGIIYALTFYAGIKSLYFFAFYFYFCLSLRSNSFHYLNVMENLGVKNT